MELYVTLGLFVLAGVGAWLLWRASRKYEARRQVERVTEIKERQLQSAIFSPKTKDELVERLKKGGVL